MVLVQQFLHRRRHFLQRVIYWRKLLSFLAKTPKIVNFMLPTMSSLQYKLEIHMSSEV